jgi:hypothetical protein
MAAGEKHCHWKIFIVVLPVHFCEPAKGVFQTTRSALLKTILLLLSAPPAAHRLNICCLFERKNGVWKPFQKDWKKAWKYPAQRVKVRQFFSRAKMFCFLGVESLRCEDSNLSLNTTKCFLCSKFPRRASDRASRCAFERAAWSWP